MTALDKSDEIAALEQARARLEAGLSRDDNWLALRQSRLAGAPANGDTGRGLRDARLERALGGNPLFVAWRLVCEAIAVVGAQETRGAHATVAPAPPAEPDREPDDLTRIRGIRAALARRLVALDVTRYGQIAGWGPADVRTISQALGLGRDISRQNWIEQAALLERRANDAAAGTVDPPRERAVDLPDILDHIRSTAPASDAGGHADVPAEQPAAVPPVAASSADGAADRALPRDVAAPAPPPPIETSAPPRLAATADLIPAVAHVDTAERLQRLEEDLRQFSESVRASAPVPRMPAWEAPLTSADATMPDGSGMTLRAEPEGHPEPESEEAIVTFVVRPPAPSIPSVAESHAAPGADPRPDALGPPPAVQRGADLPGEPAGTNGPAEEAEVIIIRPDAGKASAPPEHEQAGGSVRRFLKALTRT